MLITFGCPKLVNLPKRVNRAIRHWAKHCPRCSSYRHGDFLGIILGCLVGFFVNKLGDVKFHKYLSPYEGTKFAYVVLIFLTIIFAIAVSYIWPPINGAVNAIVGGLSGMGAFGFFLYGFLNRMLLPVGMHHLLWMPLYYTPLGGTAQVAGKRTMGQ